MLKPWGPVMDTDLDTLDTALYVSADDFLTDNPQHRPWRPKIGIAARLSTLNWSPWWCCKHCWDSPPRRGGCVMPVCTWATYFLICQHNRDTTNGCVRRRQCCRLSSRTWPGTLATSAM